MKVTTMKTRILLAVISIAALASGAYAQGGMQAQTPSSTKGAVIKGRAPVNKNLLRVKLPKAQEATLKNGMKVVLLEGNHKLPSFSMEMMLMSGGLSDPSDMRGLAATTANLLREGTAKHKSRELAEALDTIGAQFNANAGVSAPTTNISVSGLTENLDQILDLYAELIRTPTFPTEEVERFKSRSLAQQPLLRSQPQFLAAERLSQAIYGTRPAALVIAPADTLKKITSADLAKFHEQNYVANNATLFVAGDVTLKDIMPKLERAFGDWKTGNVTAPVLPPVPAQSDTRIHLINRPGSVQTVFQIGSLGLERTDPDYVAGVLMNRILGTGPGSRLFLNIREDKGYTYSVGSSFSAGKYRGLFTAQSPVRTEVTEGTIRGFRNEFKRMRDEKVSPTELQNAKNAIIGGWALQLENPNFLINFLITQKLYNLPANYWDTYPQKVEAITADDIQKVAQKYIDVNHLQ